MNTPIPEFMKENVPLFEYTRGRFIRVTIESDDPDAFMGFNLMPDGYSSHFNSEFERLCGWKIIEDAGMCGRMMQKHTKEYLAYLGEQYVSRKRLPIVSKKLTSAKELTDGTDLYPELEVYERSFGEVLSEEVKAWDGDGRYPPGNILSISFSNMYWRELRGVPNKFEDEWFLQKREEIKDSLCERMEEFDQLARQNSKKEIDNLNGGEHLIQLLSLYEPLKKVGYFMTVEELQKTHFCFVSLIPEEATVKFLRIKKDATN